MVDYERAAAADAAAADIARLMAGGGDESPQPFAQDLLAYDASAEAAAADIAAPMAGADCGKPPPPFSDAVLHAGGSPERLDMPAPAAHNQYPPRDMEDHTEERASWRQEEYAEESYRQEHEEYSSPQQTGSYTPRRMTPHGGSPGQQLPPPPPPPSMDMQQELLVRAQEQRELQERMAAAAAADIAKMMSGDVDAGEEFAADLLAEEEQAPPPVTPQKDDNPFRNIQARISPFLQQVPAAVEHPHNGPDSPPQFSELHNRLQAMATRDPKLAEILASKAQADGQQGGVGEQFADVTNLRGNSATSTTAAAAAPMPKRDWLAGSAVVTELPARGKQEPITLIDTSSDEGE